MKRQRSSLLLLGLGLFAVGCTLSSPSDKAAQEVKPAADAIVKTNEVAAPAEHPANGAECPSQEAAVQASVKVAPQAGDAAKKGGLMLPIERSMVFVPSKFPDGNWHPKGLAFEDVDFSAPDKTQLHGWFVPHEHPRAVVLFCHGNGGNITHRAEMLRELHDRIGVAVMIFDYRGYGQSEGSPDEAGVLADARAARAWLAKRAGIKEGQVVLMGESLGGAVAVDLAAKDGARALVLDSTFSSLPEVAAWHFPWVPASLLMQTRLDSAAKIGAYHGPLLEFHGDNDHTVPIQFGRKLFAAANEPKQFVLIPGGDHNDPRPRLYFDALDEFITKLGPP